MSSAGDAEHDAAVDAVRTYFDAFAEQEWGRLTATLADEVSLHVHRRFLARFVRPGMRVLEVGAGAGRFTVELAGLGARVTVTDLSPVQLRLNEQHVAQAGAEAAVESRDLLDVCDTSRFSDGEFDAVVAYGGPLSYAFDRADVALTGLLRVTRRGGPVVASVMSTLGSYRYFLPAVVEIAHSHGDDANDRILRTGDLRETQPPGSGQHTCRMFRWSDIRALVDAAGADVLAVSASNWASLGDREAVSALAADRVRWARFIDHEVELCAEPGALDGGTHLLFAAARE